MTNELPENHSWQKQPYYSGSRPPHGLKKHKEITNDTLY